MGQETLLDRLPEIPRVQERAQVNFRNNMSEILRRNPGLAEVARRTGISQVVIVECTWLPEELSLDRLTYHFVNRIARVVGKTADEMVIKR